MTIYPKKIKNNARDDIVMKRLLVLFLSMIMAVLTMSCAVQEEELPHGTEEEPLVWADKTFLEAVLAKDKEIDEEMYTSKSYDMYRNAYETALDVNNQEDADQFTIDNVAISLSRMIDKLEKRADFSDVLSLCDAVDSIDRSLFTENSLAGLDEVVKQIREDIHSDTTQKAADMMYDLLSKKVRTLVAKPLTPDNTRTGNKNPTYPYTSVFPERSDGAKYEVKQDMLSELKSICAPRSGDIGFFIYDLNTGASITYQADRSMFQASTVKAQFCLYLFNLIDKGEASFSDEIEFKQKHHSVGSGEIKNTPFGSKYTVDYLIEKALTISDNCAYHMMAERYNIYEFNKFLKGLDCKYAGNLSPGFRFGSASPRDIQKIWTEIYTYTQNGQHGDLFKGYLLESAYGAVGEGIPQYEVAHKSGWTSAQFNDFAIVYAPHPYLVITFVQVADGAEPKFVSRFSTQISKIMEDYHDFFYQNDEFYLPTAKTDSQNTTEKSEK